MEADDVDEAHDWEIEQIAASSSGSDLQGQSETESAAGTLTVPPASQGNLTFL